MSLVMANLPSGDRMIFIGRLAISPLKPAGVIFFPVMSWFCAHSVPQIRATQSALTVSFQSGRPWRKREFPELRIRLLLEARWLVCGIPKLKEGETAIA